MPEHCARAGEEALRLIVMHVHSLRLHLEGVRNENVEGIHQMRVASRRLRAGLIEFSALFERSPAKRFLVPVRFVTRSLGRPRELDVTLALVDGLRQDLPKAANGAVLHVRQWLETLRANEGPSIHAAVARVESPHFEQSLTDLFNSYRPRAECHLETGSRSLSRQLKKLCKVYQRWFEAPREKRLHRIRIRFKKLRYSAETYAPAYGPEMTRFLKRLKDTQEALGNWNDRRILRDYLTQAQDSGEPPLAEAMPLVSEAVDRQVDACLAQFRAGADGFFALSEQEGMEAFLAHPVQTCCR